MRFLTDNEAANLRTVSTLVLQAAYPNEGKYRAIMIAHEFRRRGVAYRSRFPGSRKLAQHLNNGGDV